MFSNSRGMILLEMKLWPFQAHTFFSIPDADISSNDDDDDADIEVVYSCFTSNNFTFFYTFFVL